MKLTRYALSLLVGLFGFFLLALNIIFWGLYKQKRNLKKKASEDRYYTQKKFVSGD
jgi:hypothetical protein